MNSNIEFTTTLTQRSASVVRVHGYAMGSACSQAAGDAAGALKHRAAVAFWATTPGSGRSWSPPVT